MFYFPGTEVRKTLTYFSIVMTEHKMDNLINIILVPKMLQPRYSAGEHKHLSNR